MWPDDRWEVGGEFEWMGLPPEPTDPLPSPATWYLVARHAIVELLRFLPRPRYLWVPSYFCFDVADYWRGFVETVEYQDHPLQGAPDFDRIAPGPRDLVLAVNYFGVRGGEAWRRWRESHDCVLIEDHSHDPCSGWAMRSNADYAIASLRKTLPVPDGGLLWSPRGLPLPSIDSRPSHASALKLYAMLWKREYLASAAPSDTKELYREWQMRGEEELRLAPPGPASEITRRYLRAGVPRLWRQQRSSNVRRLLSSLPNRVVRPLFRDLSEGEAPLGLVLEVESATLRDPLRVALQARNIYCPVHWPATDSTDTASRELSERLLTIPTDQRYTEADMDRVATALNESIATLQ